MTLVVGTNSYISVADALTYFNDRLYSDAFTTATPEQQAQSLVMATRAINRLQFIGHKVDEDNQALEFPRVYPYAVHDIWRQWFQDNITDEFQTLYVEGASQWADISVPQQILDATCEEALEILNRYNDPRTKLQRAGATMVRIGRYTQEEYDPFRGAAQGLLSLEARELLRPWLAGGVPIV